MPEDNSLKLLQASRSCESQKKKNQKKKRRKKAAPDNPPADAAPASLQPPQSPGPGPGPGPAQAQLPRLRARGRKASPAPQNRTGGGELSAQAKESLRWEGALEDPRAEEQRLDRYRANRRQRYRDALGQDPHDQD